MKTEAKPLPITYAAIVFKGDNLDTQMVTDIIERSPTLSYHKGDEYEIKNTVKTRAFGLWLYSTRNRTNSVSLESHLDVIEEILSGAKSIRPDFRLDKIKQLTSAGQVQLRVDVFWYGTKGATLPEIGRSFDRIVTMAGGTVVTDFHRAGDAVEAA